MQTVTFYELVALKYNEGKIWPWQTKASPSDVQQHISCFIHVPDVLKSKADPLKPRINAAEIIAIAKAVCQGIKLANDDICPLINDM